MSEDEVEDNKSAKKGRILGVDLGTTNSAMAIMEGGDPAIIENREGERTTPSVVAFEEGDRAIGKLAKNQAITNSENTVKSIKRHMGEGYTVKLDGDEYKPQEISSMILQKMKRDAEEYFGEDINKAVITVPAYFTDSQRQATKDAGEIAGFEVERIINEPTAASLAYGLKDKEEKNIFIYDLGGGTFDVSLLELDGGVFEVISTAGNNKLGGDDFDKRLVEWIADKFEEEHGIDLREDDQAHQRLRDAAEEAKKELSSKKKTNINIPFIYQDEDGAKNIDYDITRAKFESLIEELVDKTVEPCKRAMDDAGLEAGDLDDVILVGGSTRIPFVREKVKEITKMDPNKKISPDEVVARGAAIQGGSLAGEVDDLLLLDVTPLSLGVETKGRVLTKLIDRNTTIPTEETKTFTTAVDSQPQVEINVLQGERTMAKDNKSLGKFILGDLPPSPAGVPQIEVTFEIDADGILQVAAKDKGSGNERSITIQDQTRLDDGEIERMKEEAEKYEEEDEKKREKIETINKGEQLARSTRNTIEKLEEQDMDIDEDVKEGVLSNVEELEELLEKDHDELSKEEVESKIEEVEEKAQEIGKSAYGASGATSGAGAGAGMGGAGDPGGFNAQNIDPEQVKKAQQQAKKGSGEEDVVDADYEEVDEEEKE